MTVIEKELISSLKELRQIKPDQKWACLVKTQILGEDVKQPWFFLYFKPAFAGIICVLILFVSFGAVRNSMPGDLLYGVKKIAKKGQEAIFVSSDEKPAFQLTLANDSLEDLFNAPARNLAPAIDEFQANISEAVDNLTKIDAATTSPVTVKKMVEVTQKISENAQKAKSLGVVIGDEETEDLDKAIVSYLIEYLEGRTLTEEKQEILEEMKQLFEEGNFREAFEVYLLSQ